MQNKTDISGKAILNYIIHNRIEHLPVTVFNLICCKNLISFRKAAGLIRSKVLNKVYLSIELSSKVLPETEDKMIFIFK